MTRQSLLLAFVLLELITVVLSPSFAQESPRKKKEHVQDPVEMALDDYWAALRKLENPTDAERRKHREEWLATFLKVIESAPSSPRRHVVMENAAVLSNSLGQTDLAYDLSEQLLGVLADKKSYGERLFWLREHIRYAYETHDPTKIDRAVTVLREAIAFTKKRIDAAEAPSNERDSYIDLCERAVGVFMIKPETKDEAIAFQDEAIRVARMEYGGPGTPTSGRRTTQLPGLLETRLDMAADQSDDETATKLLEELRSLPETSDELHSLRLLRFANRRFLVHGSKEWREFLSKQLELAPTDSLTALVKIELAKVLKNDDPATAISLLSDVRDHSLDSLTAAVEKYKAKYYGSEDPIGDVWYNLGVAYVNSGNLEEAEKCLTSLEKVSPSYWLDDLSIRIENRRLLDEARRSSK